MQTAGLWITVPPETLAAISPDRDSLVDGLRGLTHLLHHLAPLFLMCDVRHQGSWLGDAPPAPRPEGEGARLLTAQTTRARLLAAERFEPTLYLYDQQPGGVGLSERLFELLGPLLGQARDVLAACACRAGCPSCVGPVNEVGRQAKPIAARLVDALRPPA
jgi:DEAD/DEAH box helicase domain-containing protein